MRAMEAARSLGGRRVLGTDVRSELDFVHLVEEGLSTRAIDALMALGELSPVELDPIHSTPVCAFFLQSQLSHSLLLLSFLSLNDTI